MLPAFAVFLGLASTASASVPSMEVTVFDASGKVAFKGLMSANATFATGNLGPGNYVVQLKTRSAAAKDNQFLLVVSAGKKKVIATGVPGEIFIGGGAAMKVNVGPGLKITGKVAKEEARERDGVAKYRLIDGKRYFWVIAETGSNRGGHWVEEGLAPAGNLNGVTSDDIRRRQDHAGEGSMIHYSAYRPPVQSTGY
ncbi:MAG: hypothetical protein QOK24_22 [Verrucomicrobiota bacterium]